MKKFLLILTVLTVTLFPAFVVSTSASAEVDLFKTCSTPTGQTTTVCKDINTQKKATSNPIIALLKVVLDILAFIAGAGAIILIIINSLRLILANGDSNGIKNARTGLLYALIGVAIVVSAQVIVVFVLDNVK